MNLLSVVALSPLALRDPDDPEVLHAATYEAIIEAWPKDDEDPGRPIVAPCGATGKLIGTPAADGEREKVVVWPPRHAGPLTRCRECWVATGSKRPRKGRADG